MSWVKRFKGLAPAVPLGNRIPGDVDRFLSSLLAEPLIAPWQIEQASEALRILYQEVIAAPWARPWVWPARPVGGPVVKKTAPPGPTPEEKSPLLRLCGEIGAFPRARRPRRVRAGLATHLLESGHDIRTVQELLGHADVSTTMICTHVLNRPGLVVQSPSDAAAEP